MCKQDMMLVRTSSSISLDSEITLAIGGFAH